MSGALHGERPAEAAAADWYARIRLGTPTPQDRVAFEEWMACDAAHVSAYSAYEQLWGTLGPLGADPRVQTARHDLLAPVGGRQTRNLRWRKVSIAAAAVLIVAAAIGFNGWLGGRETFVTAVGQLSTVPLEDGSIVELNTDSEIKPLYSSAERAVRLIRGQAWFEVAGNSTRPFVVYAGNRRIVALGTAFDVRIEKSGVRVMLLNGRVAVNDIDASASSRATELAPGEQLVPGQGGANEIRQADVISATGWREGRLVFSGEALADAVAEVNRYSRTRIELGDPALAALRISGVFRTGQTAGFLAALQARFPVEIAERDARRIVLVRR